MDGNTLTYESVRPVVHLADLLGSTVATFDAQGNTIADRYYTAFGDGRQASGASAKAACWSEWLGVRLPSWEPTEPEAHNPLLPHNA
jgi:hypothetical protein